ncbi:aminoglycoside phosphotransferase family protein [Lentzea sp. NPDC042327]|uniref:aminoglycoside phosphotransferase family protein n=1 Tax=Lentzea sp. NPDC042327 TaxID=3154801 RepID=UPI00340F159C
MDDPFDAQQAQGVLKAACSTIDLDSGDAELIRLGENAVFWLRSRSVVARISRGSARVAQADREVRSARWLARMSVPAVRALDVDQPLFLDGHVVTFWESVSTEVGRGSPADLAGLLRDLHALEAPPELDLPVADPFRRARTCLDRAKALSEEDLLFVNGLLNDLAARYENLSFALPQGVVHGDANVWNVFLDHRGAPVLGDLDTLAVGPRELDLTPVALYHHRLGWHTAAEYRGFVGGYGFDVKDWEGYEVLADALEIELIAWLAQNAHQSPATLVEVVNRIETIRTGASRLGWTPFL